MVRRRMESVVRAALQRNAAVALLGPRQAGKTTLALAVAKSMPSLYLDLEAPKDRAKLADPAAYLAAHADALVVLDEIQRMPELFPILRGVIDEGRRKGKRNGRFLILGSASIDLLRQSSESLAGRIDYLELGPLDVTEVSSDRELLWSRGGFPESFLAPSDSDSLEWRQGFIRTYLERDIPQLGPRVPAETLRRFWTMLAHEQSALLNAARLAAGLGVSGQTVSRYVDLLVDLLLARRLEPLHPNVGKRLVRSPKVFVRDSGLVHALLGLATREDLLGHPVAGPSWEGFVIENALALAPRSTQASFYRTATGAEIDLVLDFAGGERWALEIKRGSAPSLERGFHTARADLSPNRCLVIYSGDERYPLSQGVEAIGLGGLAELLHKRSRSK